MKMIKGIEKLTKEQEDLMKKTNKLHTEIVGLDYKDGMEIIETWIDENICQLINDCQFFQIYIFQKLNLSFHGVFLDMLLNFLEIFFTSIIGSMPPHLSVLPVHSPVCGSSSQSV